MIEFDGIPYHVTFTTDWDVYGHTVKFRRMDGTLGQVLVRVTGWDDADDSRVDVAIAVDVDARFASFAVNHAKALIGADLNEA